MHEIVTHMGLWCCSYDVNSMLFRSFLAAGGNAAGAPSAKCAMHASSQLFALQHDGCQPRPTEYMLQVRTFSMCSHALSSPCCRMSNKKGAGEKSSANKPTMVE